jgi:hypothetical protein
MGNIHEILERSEMMIHKGIEELNQQGELNASSLEMLGEALDALKDIEEIRGMSGGGSYERYYDGGYGRRRRDSMGRFMDDGYGRRYYDGYGDGYSTHRDGGYRDGGYSDGGYERSRYGDEKREERERLEKKMRNAQSEQEREMYRRMLADM